MSLAQPNNGREAKAGPLRMQMVQAPVIPMVADLIRSCPGTISLGQGVVYYSPPPQAREYATRFFDEEENHKYKAVHGIPLLLDALAEKLKSENGIETGAASPLVVTAGGNMAFMNAVLAITDPGDEIILQTPYYFNHEMAITMADCKPVCVGTDKNYQPRLDAIRDAITPKTRAIVTVSPNNPTGAVYSEGTLREVNQLCRERGLYHISDEAYEYFTYGSARHFSPASIAGAAGHTLSLFSLSKAYGFASWRIGYMVVPEHLMTSVRKIQDTLLICPPVICQYAAAGALRAGKAFCLPHLKTLAQVRETALDQFQGIREFCEVPLSEGAFYFLLRLNTEMSSMTVVERLVREYGVAVIPGNAFGAGMGCYLRVAYGALERRTAEEGIGRLVRGLKHLVTL